MKHILKYFIYPFALSALILIVILLTGRQDYLAPVIIVMLGSLALYFMGHKFLISFAFTVWVFVFVAIMHNFIGYILGYWISRMIRLDESTSRTGAFEVGMQNGGMATGLAMTVLKSVNAALAPAIFGPWMNISGSVLATWWHRKPVK